MKPDMPMMERSPAMQRCMDDCGMCMSMCMETMVVCMHSGPMTTQLMSMLQDCADMCTMALRSMSRMSLMSPRMCGMCAEVCLMCAAMCEQLAAGNEMMMRCAQMCRRCSDSCKSMAAVSMAA